MQQIVTLGEIMMRLSPPQHQRLAQAHSLEITYGGGEANVAAALAGLGWPTAHVTCLPATGLGQAAAQHFRALGVDMQHTAFRGPRLGLYFLEVGAALRASQVVYDRAGSAFAQLQPADFDWDHILQNARWLHWTGITPAISAAAATATAQAIAAARRRGITVSADVNYRRNLWQYGQRAQEVMPALVAGCDVVFCSENDAADLFDMHPADGAAQPFSDVAAQLRARFPTIRQVVTTRRATQSASHERIRAVLDDAGTYFETPFLDIAPVVDRIGGGDAFAAGFLHGWLSYPTEPLAALQFALAASALKHTIHGDINLATADEVRQVMAGNTSGRLVR